MPLSTPKWYFDNYVEPIYEDFLRDRTKPYKAVSAMIFIYHFWERLYHYYKQSKPEYLYNKKRDATFEQFLIKKCDDLQNLKNCANAGKHQIRKIYIDSNIYTSTPVLDPTSITMSANISRHFGVHGSSEAALPGSKHSVEEILVIEFLDNRPVEDLLANVMHFWRTWLAEHPTDE